MSQETNNWFDALGNHVDYKRRAVAATKASEMGLDLDGEEESAYIGAIATEIENDNPDKAIAKAREVLDLTGSYRLLAYLCIDAESIREDYQ